MERLALFAGYVVVGLVSSFGIAILGAILSGKIDLKYLISERDGGASFSRFQFLVFTLVISMCVLVLTLESGEFPSLGPDVLGLLGLSGGTYAVSKGIQKAAETRRDESIPPVRHVAPGPPSPASPQVK